MFRKAVLLPVLVSGLVLGACESSPTGGNADARVTIQLTDAPADYLASATVEISRIELLPAEGAPIVVVEDAGSYDLLQLQNGVTADLGSIDLEPGSYSQLRMIVERAEVTLLDGFTFTDGSSSKVIAVPSGAQTGIKIDLTGADGGSDEGVEIRPGETVLVVDFDVSSNFVLQGSADSPAGIKGFLFTPSLRAAVRDVAGSISGSVSGPEGLALEGLSISAVRDGSVEGEAPAATLVRADGTFTLNFIVPGTYNVTVASPGEGYVANTVEVSVGEDEDVTGVELLISAAEAAAG